MSIHEITGIAHQDTNFLGSLPSHGNVLISIIIDIFFYGEVSASNIHVLCDEKNKQKQKDLRDYIEAFLHDDTQNMKKILLSILESEDIGDTRQKGFDF